MVIKSFPPVEKADSDGLLAIGGDLEIESILKAYSQGIFPWPFSRESPTAWFSPDPRGILHFDDLIISTSMRKLIKRKKFSFQMNKNFEKVIYNCAKAHENNGVWLNQDMIDAYINLHNAGFAYSAETYNKNRELVGGLYGVKIGRFISGESMYYHESNASKFALIELILFLKQRNIKWIDTQMITPVIAKLGGKEVSRTLFIKMLNDSL
ncbi:leucyl/phenylalanyl-tRNA--protein transferase [bacterium]|jgi:leucyl/phenylalanyl-tRNA---protein transferase|nr:leucyl/phenylalanyl-tRNA--protein transferase [bacterium]MBT6324482.1 leucyl/phenylalanyl-tRNA--protein transferase [Bdellovibrionales bacterium]